jgi:hypothetical protein
VRDKLAKDRKKEKASANNSLWMGGRGIASSRTTNKCLGFLRKLDFSGKMRNDNTLSFQNSVMCTMKKPMSNRIRIDYICGGSKDNFFLSSFSSSPTAAGAFFPLLIKRQKGEMVSFRHHASSAWRLVVVIWERISSFWSSILRGCYFTLSRFVIWHKFIGKSAIPAAAGCLPARSA